MRDDTEARFRVVDYVDEGIVFMPVVKRKLIVWTRKSFALGVVTGLVLGFGLGACTVKAAEAPVKLTGRIHVVDGDTIWRYQPRQKQAEKIRIVGLDTPETFRPTCEAERATGLEAKARLKVLLKTRPIMIRYGDDSGVMEDRFGRRLARIILKKGDVADILIREGLALPYVPGQKASRNAHWCGGK